jgi:hypothetical protein
MNQEQLRERLNVMKSQEDSLYCCSDYFKEQQSRSTDGGTIDHVCRLKMTQWCYTVIDYIKFRRETVTIAMSYLDRFLCSGCPRAEQVMHCRREYQLASMTTLFMAIKINEPVLIDMNLLTELSKGIYTHEDFKKMETDILFGLNWLVNGPTPQSFALHLVSLMKQKIPNPRLHSPTDYSNLLELATYQIELSVGEYKLMTQKPSVIATAAIWNCLEQTRLNQIYRRQFFDMVSTMNIDLDHFVETKERLQNLKGATSMHMRASVSPSMLEVLQESPRSSSMTTTTFNEPEVIQCTKDDEEHCSPKCVSKRKLYDS